MTKHHDIEFPSVGFATKLVTWYRQNARSLPWRETTDPYAIWISEVMLQQTRVETVIPYYRRFLTLFPTIAALAGAAEQEVLKAWEGLGYYRRARLLHQGAQEVNVRFGGKLPPDPQVLALLPGVGSYMTGSLASIAFNLPVPAVDGNVVRVATRVLAWGEDSGTAVSRRFIAKWVQELFPGQTARDLTQSLMELGALICLPLGPHCSECPVREFCIAAAGEPQKYPVKKTARPIPVERRVVLRITRDGKQLFIRRPETGLMAGFWEYPNLPVPPGVDPVSLAEEWTQEQLGMCLDYQFQKTANHVFTHLCWLLEIYEAVWHINVPPHLIPESQWLSPDEAGKLPRVAFLRGME